MGGYKDKKICGKQYTEILIGIENFFKKWNKYGLVINSSCESSEWSYSYLIRQRTEE